MPGKILRVVLCALAKDLPNAPHPPKSYNSNPLGSPSNSYGQSI